MQFFQLAALSLGGLLISYSTSAVSTLTPQNLLGLQQVNDILLSGAVFYLVPRLPNTLHEYALRPILMAQRSQEQAVQRAVETMTQETTQMLKRAVAVL
ncbi:hypothetical protein [Ktedonospora formicarum]|uniref:Uncharacterized protein n=1 Tax=Ktedonospora formicarum TaxID=2778364 RepID=A0A8J3MUU8_9CHLR|nr:hypothetical protein [Ktedonospora formicarum]GHO48595.1 hypothetical protein KSX_67580 [Ktedonospora formicarum]